MTQDNAPEQQHRSLSIADCRALKVMVVDPNAYMRGIVADALRRCNIGQLVTTASADEAYEACHVFHPNIVITDWEAGRISGLQFTREIRHSKRNMARETPIILLASEISHDHLAAARKAGINELLLKPVSVRGLKSRIAEIVLRPRKFIDSKNYIGPCRRRRQDPNYYGPWRRLTDEPTENVQQSKDPGRYDKLRALVQQLTDFVVKDDDDYRNMVRGLYKLLASNQAGIDTMKDESVSRIWRSGIRYVEGVGMTPHYDAEVILRHFEAIASIMDMPEDAYQHKQAVVVELNRLVTKRIHSATSQTDRSDKKAG